MARPATAEGGRARWPLSAVLALAIGIATSIVACAIAFAVESRRVERDFERLAVAFATALGHEIEEQAWSLEALRMFWDSSDLVERHEFTRFCTPLLASREAVESLAFIARAEPAHEGIETYTVAFVEPEGRAAWTEGAAVGADGELARLFVRASYVRGGAAVASRGAPAPDGRSRFVAALAIREPGAPPTSSPRGFAAGSFDLERVVESARARLPEPVAGVHILDPLAQPDARVLYAQGTPSGSGSEPDATLEIGAFDWRVACSPPPGFGTSRRGSGPWVLLALGCASAAMLAWYLRSIEMRNRSLTAANAGLYTEVAERHTAEKGLRETQRALATLVANLPGAAYRCRNDKDWSMEFISEGSIPLTGHAPSEFLSGKVSFGKELIVEEDRERVWSEVQEALDEERPFQLRYRIRTAQGKVKHVWEQGQGVFSRAGELLALEGFITDVTERELTAERLAREEGRLRHEMGLSDAIIASVPGTFYVFAESGKILRWNRNVERLTGYSPDEIERMQPLDFVRAEDRAAVASAVAQVFEQGQAWVEAELAAKDGTTRPFLFTGVCFEHAGVRALVGVGTDLSERDKALRDRARFQAMLAETHELERLGLLAGAVAHDFNNLLTVVMGSAGLAQRSVDPANPAHQFLERALSASEDAAQLTRQLLDSAQPSGAVRTEVDLARLVREVAELVQDALPRRVRLVLDLSAECPALAADPAQIRLIVLNLIRNAGEACSEHGSTVRISTGVAELSADELRAATTRGRARPGRSIRLSVEDDGEGMDEATLARVGELFFSTKPGGRGLGLAAVLASARAHEGWLAIRSQRGRGTRVDVHFPLR